MVDWEDGLIALGALFLALAVGLALGWVGVLAYVGVLCLAVGLALARRAGDKVKR